MEKHQIWNEIKSGTINLAECKRTLLGTGANGTAYAYTVCGVVMWIRHNHNGSLTCIF